MKFKKKLAIAGFMLGAVFGEAVGQTGAKEGSVNLKGQVENIVQFKDHLVFQNKLETVNGIYSYELRYAPDTDVNNHDKDQVIISSHDLNDSPFMYVHCKIEAHKMTVDMAYKFIQHFSKNNFIDTSLFNKDDKVSITTIYENKHGAKIEHLNRIHSGDDYLKITFDGQPEPTILLRPDNLSTRFNYGPHVDIHHPFDLSNHENIWSIAVSARHVGGERSATFLKDKLGAGVKTRGPEGAPGGTH